MQSTRPTTQQRRRPGGRRFFPRRKVCQFCVDKVTIDYKDVSRNRRFISEWGKIESRRKTGTCSPHQRQLALAMGSKSDVSISRQLASARHQSPMPIRVSGVWRY